MDQAIEELERRLLALYSIPHIIGDYRMVTLEEIAEYDHAEYIRTLRWYGIIE